MNILVAIANHGTKNMTYLNTLIQEYRSMALDVDIVVLSNVQKNLGSDIEVIVGLPTKAPKNSSVYRCVFRHTYTSKNISLWGGNRSCQNLRISGRWG